MRNVMRVSQGDAADTPQPMEEDQDVDGDAPDRSTEKPGIICLAALMQRCGDKAPTVRGKAVGTFASLLGSNQQMIIDWAQQASLQACIKGCTWPSLNLTLHVLHGLQILYTASMHHSGVCCHAEYRQTAGTVLTSTNESQSPSGIDKLLCSLAWLPTTCRCKSTASCLPMAPCQISVKICLLTKAIIMALKIIATSQ